MLSKLTEKIEIGLSETSHLIEQEDTKAEVRLRSCLEELATDCNNYLQITKPTLTGPGTGKTKLDKERIKLCQREVETIGNMARNLRALVTRSSLKERFKTAQTYLQKLRFLIEDVSMKLFGNGDVDKVYPSWKSLGAGKESCMFASYCLKLMQNSFREHVRGELYPKKSVLHKFVCHLNSFRKFYEATVGELSRLYV